MGKLRKMPGKADSPYIASLMRLIETQSKATIAAVSIADEPHPAKINWNC